MQSRLNGSGTMRCVKVDVPKEHYVTRPAVILDPIDRLAYQAIVDYLSPSIVGHLATFVYGWRLSRREPIKGLYVNNSKEWERYRHRLAKLAFTYSQGLSTDVVSFFASVPVEDLMEEIGQLVGSSKVQDRLRDLLASWQKVNGRSGLPQRCMASSVLAHFYLRPIDDLLARRTKMRSRKAVKRYRSCRWMDDIWVFSNKESKLRTIQLELQQALSQRRLNLNVAKTKVAMGPDLEENVQAFEHSAVDNELQKEGTSEELDELINRIVANPTTVSRTTIRFVTKRMRDHKLFNRVDELARCAERMPHGADHLARLLRDSGVWVDLQDWYTKYAKSEWGQMAWSVYQLGTMFPSNDKGKGTVLAYFIDGLDSGSLPQFATPLAAQRIAAWDPNVARDVIKQAADKATHPFELRAFALAGLTCRIPSTLIKKWLGEFPDTQVLLKFLQARRFRPPAVAPDFSGN